MSISIYRHARGSACFSSPGLSLALGVCFYVSLFLDLSSISVSPHCPHLASCSSISHLPGGSLSASVPKCVSLCLSLCAPLYLFSASICSSLILYLFPSFWVSVSLSLSLSPYLSHAMCVSLSRPTAYPPVPSLWRDVSPHPSQALLLFREPLRLPNSPPALSLGPSWLLLPCSTLPLSRSLPPPPGQRPTPHPNLPGDPPARLRQPPAEAGGEHWAGAADAGTGSSLGL